MNTIGIGEYDPVTQDDHRSSVSPMQQIADIVAYLHTLK